MSSSANCIDEQGRAPGLKKDGRLKETKKPELPTLPPCQICDGKASGFHFGVLSCESCKVFFKRSLTRDSPYECKNQQKCVIKPGKWTSCSACRLNKCLEQGMSPSAVKKGRHSLERKKNCKNLVRQIEEEEKKKREEKEELERQRKEAIAELVTTVLKVHNDHLLVTPEVLKIIRENEAQRKEINKKVEEETGPAQPLPPEYIREFYELTGFDLGGLKAKFQVCMTTCHEVLIRKCIAYSKALPGFLELPLNDRIQLIKGAMLDWYLMSRYQVVNWQDKMYSCVVCGVVYTEEEYISVIPDYNFFDGLRPSQTLQRLELQTEEVAVLRAFVFFDTSRYGEDFEAREKIDKLQNRYLECLLQVLEEHRGEKNASLTFAKLSHVLTQTRDASKWKMDLIEAILHTYKDMKLSQLFIELFNIDSIENIRFSSDLVA